MFHWVNYSKMGAIGLGLVGFPFALGTFFSVSDLGLSFFFEWKLFQISGGSVSMTLIVDWISVSFISLVLIISASVLYYSSEYMEGDPHQSRFFIMVLLFVGSMAFLIFSPNLVSLLLGWDGLGLVSYALVVFYQNEKSAAAGMVTALSNRVGDAALLIGIGLMYFNGGFSYIFYMSEVGAGVCGFIILAAMTKSAQIPFSAWLPAAMAAPTPVSALVHSSTLVTAGVFLMIRFSEAASYGCMSLMMFVGILTSVLAGLGANLEFDLKKIIALSTLSQLGVMVSAVGVGLPLLAFFHLVAHALFKALLFMAAGGVIHSGGGYQDLRFLSSATTNMPGTSSMLIVASLALCGGPFLTGFYSKDLIIEMVLMGENSGMLVFLYCVATGLTVVYSIRLVGAVMVGSSTTKSLLAVGESSSAMLKSMCGLGLGGVAGGALLSWFMTPAPSLVILPAMVKAVTFIMCGVGFMLGGVLWYSGVGRVFVKSSVNNEFVGSMWFLASASSKVTGWFGVKGGEINSLGVDKGWFEFYGGGGLSTGLGKVSSIFDFSLQNSVKFSLFLPLAGVLGAWCVVLGV